MWSGLRLLPAILYAMGLHPGGHARFALAGVLLLHALAGAVASFAPAAMGLAFSRVAGGQASPTRSGLLGWAATHLGDSLWGAILLAGGVTAVGIALGVFATRRSAEVTAIATSELREVLLTRIVEAPTRRLQHLAAELMRLLSGSRPRGLGGGPGGAAPPVEETLKLGIIRDAPQAAELALQVVTGSLQASVALLLLGWELLPVLPAAAGTVVLFVLSRLLSDRASRAVSVALADQQRVDGEVFSRMSEAVSAKEEIRVLGAWGAIREGVRESLSAWAEKRSVLSGKMAMSSQSRTMFAALAPLLLLVALRSTHAAGPGELATLLLVIPMFYARLEALDAARVALVERRVVLEMVHAILATPKEDSGTARLPASELRGEVSFDKVYFRPDGASSPVLDGLSLKVAAGEMVGICGKSGSGKSTLARLLAGLDVPDQGRVLIDGKDLRDLARDNLPEVLVLAGQSSRLLERTVRDNLLLGATTKHDDGVLERILSAMHFDGPAEWLSQRFVAMPPRFSGGEQKRLVLARALLRNAPILVLDEPEAALPIGTARSILAYVAEQRRGKTTLVITQNPELVATDRNVLLHGGRIACEGTHAKLLASSEEYRALVATLERQL